MNMSIINTKMKQKIRTKFRKSIEKSLWIWYKHKEVKLNYSELLKGDDIYGKWFSK